MVKVLFVCYGNICRSPMAEFVFRDMVQRRGVADQVQIASAATSTEEIGNPVHHGTRAKLAEFGIRTDGKTAVQLKKKDYESYDYLIGMERMNIKDMLRIVGGDSDNKICRLLDFTSEPGDIADPWYTGNFDRTYKDVLNGCEAFYAMLCEKFD